MSSKSAYEGQAEAMRHAYKTDKYNKQWHAEYTAGLRQTLRQFALSRACNLKTRMEDVEWGVHVQHDPEWYVKKNPSWKKKQHGEKVWQREIQDIIINP
jgi:hypothetical protein